MSSTLSHYFSDLQVECPYDKPFTAVYRQAHVGTLPAIPMELFLEAGFRRNGNYLYSMACPECQACVPIRLEPDRFVANRSQKRTRAMNQDLTVTMAPLRINNEKLNLCDKFLRQRFPGKESTALDYYAGFFINSMGATYELEFRHQERLIGVSVVDIHAQAINCVYFYFDPDEARRSPGTNNILHLIDYTRSLNIPFLYLGYWIHDLSAMRYKARFTPHFLLQDGQWRIHPNNKHTVPHEQQNDPSR